MGMSQFKMGKFNSFIYRWLNVEYLDGRGCCVVYWLTQRHTRQVLLEIWQANTTDDDDDIVNQMKHSF